MIADFAISLSRQKKDKVNGTGRFHIMKNRYGMDGLTFNAKVDTSTGHIEFLNQLSEDDEDDIMGMPMESYGKLRSSDIGKKSRKLYEEEEDTNSDNTKELEEIIEAILREEDESQDKAINPNTMSEEEKDEMIQEIEDEDDETNVDAGAEMGAGAEAEAGAEMEALS